ncbi:MAG: glycoside hydrolase family 97 protein [Bacteroidota bacterium]
MTYEIHSPNQKLTLSIKITDKVYYAVKMNEAFVVWYSPLSMTLANGRILGQSPRIKQVFRTKVDGKIPTVWGIRNEIVEQYEELVLEMAGNYNIIFRAYDDGVAYRFQTKFKRKIRIVAEEVAYRFLENERLLAHVVGDFQTSYEKLYTDYHIADIIEAEFISLPLLVRKKDVNVLIAESDLFDYPGMYIQRTGNNNRFEMQGLFPQLPTTWEPGGLCQFNLRVTQRAGYLADTTGSRFFPWRALVISETDKGLLDNDLVYKLARPCAIETDWIRPGKVAWDWFNDWNLTGVDFETGVNNRTYEYYIDFAAQNNLEYVILDEGWSDVFDLLLPKPTVDVPYLVKYAEKRGIGIVLWAVWHTLDRQMERALDQFVDWGVKGVKVDFIDRDDQIAINFYERIARETAKRKLLINIHGCSKPTGLHRMYPNVINYEGVRGNEYNKFDKDETPNHNVNLLFTRMVVGPMDYTPGSMRNSTQGKFFTDFNNPMSHGTRCHQLAMYILYYSPMQMLCDAPTAYELYPDILQFLGEVPTIWDETIALEGEIGQYAVMARRKGTNWYIGAMTNWSPREVVIDCSFLGKQKYQATLFVDGINAHRQAEDYRVAEQKLTGKNKLNIQLKPGGGAAIQLKLT